MSCKRLGHAWKCLRCGEARDGVNPNNFWKDIIPAKLTTPNERNEESAEYLRGVKDGSKGKLFEKITVDTEIPRELVEPFIQAERTRIKKALKGLKKEFPKEIPSLARNVVYDGLVKAHNQALDQAIKAVGESAEKGKE